MQIKCETNSCLAVYYKIIVILFEEIAEISPLASPNMLLFIHMVYNTRRVRHLEEKKRILSHLYLQHISPGYKHSRGRHRNTVCHQPHHSLLLQYPQSGQTYRSNDTEVFLERKNQIDIDYFTI